jgi:hypothetical protein
MNRPLTPEELAAQYYGGAIPAAPPGQAPIDMGEVDAPIDMGEIDQPQYLGEADDWARGGVHPTPTGVAAALPQAVRDYWSPPDPQTREPTSFQREITVPPVVISDAPERTAAPAPTRAAVSAGKAVPRNPDPFGVKGAREKVLGTFDKEAAGTERIATMQEDAAFMLGEKRAEQAREREEDAAIARIEQEKADRDFEAKFAEAQRQLDDVRAKKVDPSRHMRDSGVAFMSVLGGILGGAYMGLNRMDKNPFLENLNREIDRDIDVQQREIDNGRQAASDRLNLVAQQRAVFKDSQLAKLQARNLYYEAAKESLAADAAKYEGRIEAERARMGITALERAQGDLDRQWKEQAAKLASQQAAAGAAAMKDQRKELRAAYLNLYDKAIGAGYSPQQAESEAERGVQILFMGGAAARPAGESTASPINKAGRDKAAQEAVETEARIKALQAGSRSVDAEVDKYKQGRPGDITSKVPGLSRIPGTDAQAHRLEVEDWNTRATLLLGPVVEAMNKGKPGAVELHTLQEQVHITPEMTAPEKVARMRRLQALQNDAASIFERDLAPTKGAGVQYLDEKGKPAK